jgi:hypothetical protein
VETENAAIAMDFMYLAMDLDDRAVKVGVPSVDLTSLGTEAVTGVGFEPAALLLATYTGQTINTVLTGANQTLGFGAADGTAQAMTSLLVRNGQANSEARSTASDVNIANLVITSAAHDYIADLDSFDADGFTLNVTDTSGAVRLMVYLAIEEPRLIVSDTESVEISEEEVLSFDSLQATEDIEIADMRTFAPDGGMNKIVGQESVEIGDELGVVQYIETSETIVIDDRLHLVGTGIGGIFDEDVEIGDGAVLWLGELLGHETEFVEIADGFDSGPGLVATPVGKTGRGRTVQAGAVMGTTAQAGVKKGRTLS